MHLPDADNGLGALLAFSDEALYTEVKALRQPADCPNAAAAFAQCERLPELAERQLANLAGMRRGLHEAAGLETPEPSSLALATAVAVQVPLECDVATFYAYVEQENTPVRWRSNPDHAAEHAALMDQTYGDGHDAYRPLFALDAAVVIGI